MLPDPATASIYSAQIGGAAEGLMDTIGLTPWSRTHPFMQMVRQQIRSWIFDSNGGFGESTWVNNGEDWLIRASNVLPDGSRSTAEHVLTKVDDNKFAWQSQSRTLNGEPQPSLDKIEVQRLAGSQ